MAIGFTHVAITPFDKRARHHGCCARRKTHSGGIMVAEGFTHVAMTPFNVLRACSDFDHTVRALNFGAPHFPTHWHPAPQGRWAQFPETRLQG